ncbi:hypothetical protein [Aquipseudomonas guryensis]|jgi:hypothetical protein|uniref:Uncharacterized protein n=1 Tax=Aquipseudomonas guryensis TaxID=2759165 RepID=A0A7W4DB92_9GAMM|nr:hypothetical protein [Pseudomonas guryensis]MBB1519127.1 hypothetical protein [Pseudomonas guryensis]
MYTLLDFKDKNLADYLNSALRRHGLDSYVLPSGLGPDGEEIFSISCLQSSELKQGRHLIYSSRYFLNDIAPEAASELREIRNQHAQGILKLLTSKPAIIASALAMTAAALGYIFDL